MFDLNANSLLLIVFASVAVGGLLYVFAYPLLSGEVKADKRKATLMAPGARKAGERQIDANARRKQVTDSLKEIEMRNKRTSVSLEVKIAQAGLTWTRRQFYIYSVVAGILMAGLVFMLSKQPLVAVC